MAATVGGTVSVLRPEPSPAAVATASIPPATTVVTPRPPAPIPPTTDPVTTAPAPVHPTTPDQALALPADRAAAEFARLAAADRSQVAGLVGSWVPQLSSKCVGVAVDIQPDWVPDGALDVQRVSMPEILAFHLELVSRFGALAVRPTTLGIATNTPASGMCRGEPVWASIRPESFATADAANVWCAANVPPVDECQARYVARPGETSKTKQRR